MRKFSQIPENCATFATPTDESWIILPSQRTGYKFLGIFPDQPGKDLREVLVPHEQGQC